MMNSRGRLAWRVDAIDARAGFAFASFRNEEVDVAAADCPAAFVVGPDFQPTRLSDRILGLAAARRTFQRGLFLADAEVTFATLDDIAEFTRRCYLRGGGGDGVDRGGGGPPPQPTEQGPHLPQLPEGIERLASEEAEAEGASFTIEFRSEAKRFWQLARTTSGGNGSLVDWGKVDVAKKASLEPAPQRDGQGCLVRGATTLAHEFLKRLPVRGNEDEFIRWHLCAQRFGNAVGRLGLWPLIAAKDGPLSSSLKALTQQFQATYARDLVEFSKRYPDPDEMGAIWGQLFGGMSARPFYRHEFRWLDQVADGDPMDVLEGIPVPRAVMREVHILKPHDLDSVSLQDVLSAVLGSPPANPGQAVIDLVLFAASCITAIGEQPIANDALWLPSRESAWLSPLRRRAIARAAGRAKDWLVGQLPRRVFGEDVEIAVRESTNLPGYRDRFPREPLPG